MNSWRRFFDRLLLAGAVAMAIISLVVVFFVIRTVRDISADFNDNLTFYVGQVEQETLQVIDFVSQYTNPEPSKSKSEMLVRFDILWSRVFLDRRDLLGQASETSRTAAATIKQYRETMTRMDPIIAALDPNDRQNTAVILSELRALLPAARELRLAAKDSRAASRTTFLNNQLRQTYLVFGLIVGMTLFGILSIVLLRINQHEIRTMNTRLEDRVRQRTKDLESANKRLAAEILERQRNQDLAAEREARLAQAVKLAKLGYYIWDMKSDRCEFCSDLHAAAFGMSVSAYLDAAQSPEEVLALVHPEDRDKLRDKHKELRKKKPIEVGYRVLTPNGIRRLREVVRPVLDHSGRVVRAIGSTLDVTDQFEITISTICWLSSWAT